MSDDSNVEPYSLKKPPLVDVEEDAPPPYGAVDAEAAISQSTPTLECQTSRVKAFLFTILYTAAFAVTTLILCLYGSLAVGSPHDERLAGFTRAIYASILGSVVIGPVYLSNKRFMTFVKARHEVINVRIANGRLFKALGHSVIFCAVVIGVVASAASLGYALIFWPIVYSDKLSAEKMVLDAVLVPVACLIGGIRWSYEMVNLAMWILVRVPKISTGLEGVKYDRLLRITVVFTVFRLMTEGATAALPLCLLFLRPGLMDKCVAYYDRYREPTLEAAGPRPELSALA